MRTYLLSGGETKQSGSPAMSSKIEELAKRDAGEDVGGIARA